MIGSFTSISFILLDWNACPRHNRINRICNIAVRISLQSVQDIVFGECITFCIHKGNKPICVILKRFSRYITLSRICRKRHNTPIPMSLVSALVDFSNPPIIQCPLACPCIFRTFLDHTPLIPLRILHLRVFQPQIRLIYKTCCPILIRDKLVQILNRHLFPNRERAATTTVFRNRANHAKTLKQALILHLVIQ